MKKYLAILLTLAMTACGPTNEGDTGGGGSEGPVPDPAVDTFILNARGAYDLTDTTPTTVSTLLVDTLAEGATYKVGDIIKKSDSTVIYTYKKQYSDIFASYTRTDGKFTIVGYDAVTAPAVPTLVFYGPYDTEADANTAGDNATAETPVTPTKDPLAPAVVPVDPFDLPAATYEIPNGRSFVVTEVDGKPFISETLNNVPTELYTYVKGLNETEAIFTDKAIGTKFVGIKKNIHPTSGTIKIDLYVKDGKEDATWTSASGVRFTERHLYKTIDSGGANIPVKILLGVNSVASGPAKYPKLGTPPIPGLEGINATRIPGMYTLDSGTVIVAADARGKGQQDTPHNIDSFVRISKNNGNSWTDAITNHMYLDYAWDYTSGHASAYSAAFIDSSLVQAANGDVVSIVNGFSAGGGIFSFGDNNGVGGSRNPNLSPFYDIDGKRYLLLVNTTDAPFFVQTEKDKEGRFIEGRGVEAKYFTNLVLLGSYSENPGFMPKAEFDAADRRSKIRGLNKDGSIGDPVNHEGSANWELDEYWRIWKDGKIVKIDQRNHRTSGTKVEAVAMFADAPFRVVRNSYAFVNRSRDEGQTWEKYSKDVSWHFRNTAGNKVVGPDSGGVGNWPSEASEAERARQMYIVSPGRGHRMTAGKYKDRLFTILYDVPFSGNGNCRAIAIFSDDNGNTWKRGGEMNELPGGATRASETQVVEAPDGTVIAFARGAGEITMYQSKDGGMTWPRAQGTGLVDGQWNGTMVSAINLKYSKGANNEALIAFAHPDDAGARRNGTVRIVELRKNSGTGYWDVKWKDNETSYSYFTRIGETTADAATRSFGYSVLTELTNGNIALFAESGGQMEYYEIGLQRR